MNRSFLFALLIFSSFEVHAQSGQGNGGCPGGMVPGYGRCYEPNDPERWESAQGSQTPLYTGPLWRDRYGALANDGNGAGGVAQNMESARAAKKEALRDCGNSNCKIKISVRNACLATTWGGGVSGYGTGNDAKGAENDALNNCRAGGGDSCVVKYSACSLPERVQ